MRESHGGGKIKTFSQEQRKDAISGRKGRFLNSTRCCIVTLGINEEQMRKILSNDIVRFECNCKLSSGSQEKFIFPHLDKGHLLALNTILN